MTVIASVTFLVEATRLNFNCRQSRRTPRSTEQIIAALNPILQGWGQYYKRSHVRKLFTQLDAWIVRCLWSHRCKHWRCEGWKQLPQTKLYGELKLVSLLKLHLLTRSPGGVLPESCMRENCTCSLSGGRRPARTCADAPPPTRLKVKGRETYLYRAVDSTGQTIDFLLTAKRDTAAAKRFFRKMFRLSANPIPRVINVDKNPAYPAAIKELKRRGTLPRRVRLRQCKCLNNVIEQDRRLSKKRVWLAKGYKTFPSARRTLEGIETMHLIRKGRVRRVAKKDVVAEARFMAKLFGLAA